MEAFSLLKYWRGGGLGGASGGDNNNNGANLRNKSETTTTTIVTAIANQAVETDDDDGDDDDGPFFDLEFAVPDDEEEEEEAEDNKKDEENSCEEEEENDDVESDDDGDEREFKFTLSSNSSNDRTDPNLILSPSDDLFFKGRLVPIEPSFNSSEPNSKPQFPVSLLKSATKFRVFMLGFKKSKPSANEKTETTNGSAAPPKQQQQKPEDTQQEDTNNNNNNNKKESNKFFTVKFKVEEVPIMSLFTRDNSSRSSSTNNNNNNNKPQKQNISDDSAASDEKKFSKDVMQKYLKKVKPLYIRVSKRYGEKLRFSGQLSLGSGPKASTPQLPQSTVVQKTVKATAEKSQPEAESVEAPVSNVKSLKQANIPAGLRVVCKHLGKSRSASSAVAAAPPGSVPSRRDDSLLEQQDGIQSAILHCKRSFNASRDCESTLLSRSVSDPSREKSIDLSRKKSSDKGKINLGC